MSDLVPVKGELVAARQGFLTWLGIDDANLDDVPRLIAKVDTDRLVQGVMEAGETLAAFTTRFRRDVGFVLWELRRRYDDTTYMEYERQFEEWTGYGERALRNWRNDIAKIYGTPVQQMRNRRSELQTEQDSVEIPAVPQPEAPPIPEGATGLGTADDLEGGHGAPGDPATGESSTPQWPSETPAPKDSAARPAERGQSDGEGVRRAPLSPAARLKVERGGAKCPAEFAPLLAADPDLVAAPLTPTEGDKWIKEIEGWLIAFKGAIRRRNGSGVLHRDDVTPSFKGKR